MKNYIQYPRVAGTASRQAHADLPAGTYEREMGKEGFFGPASFFYHRRPPTGWSNFEGPLRPHAFDLSKLAGGSPASGGAGPWDAPVVLFNAHTELRYWQISGNMDHLARNADGDQLLFVHRGAGELYCDFGHLSFATGDYLLLPRGTMWRLECREAAAILLLEATNSSYLLPDRGLLGPHALFDAAMLDIPAIDAEFRTQQTDHEWRVRIKRRGAVSIATFPYNPLDATGWHGDLCACRINVKDFRPVMSHRYHLPPSVHSTFVAQRFVVCTFTPRPFETDPGAIKVPFFHNNDDYDEVIFYHAGNFFSRDNIHPGMVTYHPAGFTHGPHPKALERMLVQSKAVTDEVAVMIDCRDALEIGAAANGVELAAYVDSWKGLGKVKLASLKSGRDGRLVVVSRDLTRCIAVPEIAATMQQALDRWDECVPCLLRVTDELNSGRHGEAFPAGSGGVAAPLPRAFHWVDGSAYVTHVELVRRARGVEIPPSFWTDPLVYQGGADDLLGPTDDAQFLSEDWGIDLEAEVAVITGDVAMGSSAEQVRRRRDIRLLMLVNDWTLRNLTPAELAKGFGFYQSKPATGFSPVAVTPDELGVAWDGGRLNLPLRSYINAEVFGAPEAGVDMTFDFNTLIAHCAKTRNLRAGAIVGSGTVSNTDRSKGSSCLAELRMIETIAGGKPITPFLKFGDRVRIEMTDARGASIFGAIDQRVVRG